MYSSDQIRQSLVNRIYDINEKDFPTVAKDIRQYQFDHNPLYNTYCNLLGINHLKDVAIEYGPYLPISMFRDHLVRTGEWQHEAVFRSSGTTGSQQSTHLVRDTELYHRNALKIFSGFFGAPEDYAWIALLPSYLERNDSSLVDMVHFLMQRSNDPANGFYKIIDDRLIDKLLLLKKAQRKTILFGVTFALLDLFNVYPDLAWNNLIVIETGGMKGRGPEITREELHERIRSQSPDIHISSEYGMTELMSQAYMRDGKFFPGITLRPVTRDISDPMTFLPAGQRGAMNFIDLSNIDTCAFIATDDIGITYENGSFDILGRLDQSDIRGCNLLYS